MKDKNISLSFVISIAVLLAVFIFSFSCVKSIRDAGVTDLTHVSALEVKTLLDERDDIVIIDVRTRDEYAAGHIEHARNIDISDNTFQTNINMLPRDAAYLVYCRSGNRSMKAIKVMIEKKFLTVYHLKDGIKNWVAAGYPLVTDAQ